MDDKKMDNKERLQKIIEIAEKLNWIIPSSKTYPLMQLSEVEKCMMAMVDDGELSRLEKWIDNN